jgi:hypothetical protein
VQLAPELTALFWQLSVSLKSPLAAIEETCRPIPPVFVSVTVCALLGTSEASLGYVSEVGLTSAVVNCVPAVHNGICHTPRPYVAATRTFSEADAGAALS